jgi:hypothetical protein
MTFAHLLRSHDWRPIVGCPGRYVLRSEPPTLSLRGLLGETVPLRAHRVAAAKDEVWAAQLPDGGLISYCRGDGTWVHTLNTPEGFRRKLSQLGIEAD